MIKYVFFDLDETIIDIKYAQNMAIVSLYKNFGFDKETDVNSFARVWDDLTELHYADYTRKKISYEEQRKRRIVDLFEVFDIELTMLPLDVYDIYLKDFESFWICFDDVKETLETLKKNNYKLGIISNGDYNQQVQKLKNTGIFKYFDYVNTSSQFNFSKPNPKLFENIFSAYSIPLDEVCYVGDSYNNDYLPCKELRVKALLLNRTGEKSKYKSITQISSLTEILDNIK